MLLFVFSRIIYLALYLSFIYGEESKRLLVNDPNAVQNMLHEYEIRLQGYQTLVQQLQQKVAALEGNENVVRLLQQKVAALEGNQTAVIQLQQDVTTLKGNQNMIQQDVTALKGNQTAVQHLQQDVTALKGNQAVVQQLQKDVTALKQNQTALQHLQQDVTVVKGNQNLIQQNLQQELNSHKAGSTYVRWGRKTCPTDNNTEIVYEGVVGGSHFSHQGAAVDYLCLPHDPDYTINSNSIYPEHGDYTGLLYGSEYQFNYRNVKIDDVVPCAVCRVRQTSSVLMIPAKSSCPQDWKMQYSGLLSSNRYAHVAASQFVCVDGNPEYIEGTRSHNDDGKLFFPVKAVCGSLPCPPYVNNAYYGCVVCIK